MPNIYLSPSTQEFNPYAGGGNEEYYMNLIADAMEPYLYTNIPRGQLANEVWAAKDYERMDTIKPEGTHEIGADGFMEFYPDAASLQQAVLQLFYEQVE